MRVGFIGLGNMGQAMARNLIKAGQEVTVYNRTRSRAEELSGDGARIADSPAEAARHAEAVITMLSDDQAVEEIVFGGGNGDRGLMQALCAGAVHISMSTISVALSGRLAEAHRAAQQPYIAAPVFGRPEAAAEAKLSILAAGPPDQIERCRPLFEAMGPNVFVVGQDAPAANVVKIAGNFMIASMLEALGEAFALVRKSGLEAQQFLEIINGALFKSPVYQNYGTIIASERYEPAGFKMKLGLKDARLVLAAADAVAVPMPGAGVVHGHFLSGVARGQGELDWAALARVIAENAGIDRTTEKSAAKAGR